MTQQIPPPPPGFSIPDDIPPPPPGFAVVGSEQPDQSTLQGMSPEEIAELPEIGQLENSLLVSGVSGMNGKEFGASFKLALGSLVSSDPEQKIKIIQDTLPEAKIETLPTGETIVQYNDQKYVLNKPGASAADATFLAGQFVAFLPVVKVAQLAKSGVAAYQTWKGLTAVTKGAAAQRQLLTAQVIGGGAGGAGVSIGLDKSAAALGDAEGGVSGGRAAANAIFGSFGEIAGPLFRGAVNKFRGTPSDLKYIDLESVKNVKEAGKRVGIDILEPQATRAKADSMNMRILQDLPQTQQRMLMTLNNQNEQAAAATANLLFGFGDSTALSTAPKQVRKLALQAIDDMKAARFNLTDEVYKEAFAARTLVDTKPMLAQIDAALALTSSSQSNLIRQNLIKARDMLTSDATDGMVDLEILHSVKINLDDMLKAGTDSSITNSAKQALRPIRNNMVDAMSNASPRYNEARELYKEASAPIDELLDGVIGTISKLKDGSLEKGVLKYIFNPSNSNVETLTQVKSIIQAQDPKVWDMLIRANMEDRIGNINVRAIEGATNAPLHYLKAIFGNNPKQREMMYAAMSPEQAANAKWLEDALEAASRGRTGGSDTAAKQEAIKTMSPVGTWFDFLNPLGWSSRISEVMKQAKFERHADAMVDAILSPEWSAEMAKLRTLSPTDSASARSAVQLFNNIIYNELEDATSGYRTQPVASSRTGGAQ